MNKKYLNEPVEEQKNCHSVQTALLGNRQYLLLCRLLLSISAWLSSPNQGLSHHSVCTDIYAAPKVQQLKHCNLI